MKPGLLKVSVVLSVVLAGCSSGSSTSSAPPSISVPSSVLQTEPTQYGISGFATTKGSLRPDDMVLAGSSVFVIVQDNNVNPDGTLAKPGAQSMLYKYDQNGNLLASYNLPGHPDGIALYDANTLWISTNEDANTQIVVFNISAGTSHTYSYDAGTATLPHGGGLDDLKLINGVVYATASAPVTVPTAQPSSPTYSTDASGATGIYGVNTGPVLYAIALNADGVTYHATPALMSNITVNSLPSNTPITLNMTDPDSSAIDPKGNLVISSQQDSELVVISNVGQPSQSVSVVNMTLYGNPWPLDDTRWVPALGATSMLVSDAPGQIIYRITASAGFVPGTAYSAGQGTVLLSNTTSGVMTPLFTGLNNPHGIIFLPN